LLITVAMRPLLAETYQSSLPSIVRAIGTEDALTPAATAWCNLAIWAAAVAATASALLRRRPWRATGIEIGALALLLGAVVSTVIASNKRLAANASCDWLTALVMLIVLANLCRDRLRIALVRAAITASGMASAAKCLLQVGVEFAETRQMYEEHRDEFWNRQGIPLDDSRVELYERRMQAGEASGFAAHSNTAGAWLGLAGFAVLALGGLAASRARLAKAVCAAVAITLFSTILTTRSTGAMVAAGVGFGLWLPLRFVHRRGHRHWRAVLIAVWLGIIAAVAAVVAVGSARGALPGASLSFRWNYWQVTSRMIAQYPWTGVGARNFDRAYLALKPIEYPEEIRDPHNFLMAVLSQWGIPGGAGLVLVLVGGSVVVARTWGRPRAEDQPRSVPPDARRASSLRWIAAVVAGYLMLRLWLFVGQLHRAEGVAAAIFDLGFYGLIWSICAAGTVWLVQGAKSEGGDGDRYRLACLCGVVAFLLHNMIGLSLFSPGALTPFMAVCGVLLARGQPAVSDRPPVAAGILPALTAIVGFICFLWVVFIPVTRSSRQLALARRAPVHRAPEHYLAAADADPLDPTPLVELADWRAQSGQPGDLTRALAAIHRAILRDPDELALYRKQSKLLEMRYTIGGSTADLLAAIGAAEKAVQLYPASPDEHAALADLLARAAAEFEAHQWRSQAREHYERALDLDAARPAHEIRRWSTARRHQVQQCLERIIHGPTDHGPPARPSPATQRHD